ncbi:putative proteasome-type protease [Rhodovulum bhavnagarense]|uniref:Putative proteasome-type protease n=1 Tax=Rhodovulum bhavnagarense TaxID=992286 RepID=A0A4R2RJZ2_9RHOB|nr:peptidase [Rhodovulum bhavnagarense]TCP62849.1 putative proteasome-type protease [Rhodovulum bhavnagarense]
MTYCLALKLTEGLVCLSDTRTNAGVDNIAKYRKTFTWSVPGDRAIVMMTAGNLAVTQAVMSLLQENIDHPESGIETLFTAPSMFRVAEIVGDAMRVVQNRYGPGLSAMGESAVSSIILAGQRAGGKGRLFHVYSAGNFIEATEDTPYFQIGEHKYGKPILDRVITPETPLETGITAALLSMDSTLRSNLSVGMPLDLSVIKASEIGIVHERRIEENDANFLHLSDSWSAALRSAFADMTGIRV